MDAHVKKYIDSFGDPSSESGTYPKDSRIAKAYEIALDIRKFEIELYWKRSTSFWLLVGGIAAALGLLLSGKSDSSGSAILSLRGKEIACFLLSLSGATICYAWKLVNDGSKFWQSNWEYQVAILEQQVLGPLYKTVMSSEKNKLMYSVSKINVNISRYFCYVFATAAIVLLIGTDGQSLLLDELAKWVSHGLLVFIVKLLVVCAHIWFCFKLRGTGQTRDDNSNFDTPIEVSVRQVLINRGPYGTEKAKDIWDDPLARPKADSYTTPSILQNLVRFLSGCFPARPKDK